MNRGQLDRAILSLTNHFQVNEIIVFGSQSILGSYDTSSFSMDVNKSKELDANLPLPVSIKNGWTQDMISHDINKYFGEFSHFHDKYDFYIDGISQQLVTLPEDWERRLVTYKSGLDKTRVAHCLSPYDLCIAKLSVTDSREHDQKFIAALIKHDVIKPEKLMQFFNKTLINDHMTREMRNHREQFIQHYIDNPHHKK